MNDEYVPEDDAIIGRVFRRSLLLIAAVAVIVLAVFFTLRTFSNRPEAETGIETAAPLEVEHEASPPEVRFTDVTAEAGIGFVHSNGATGEKLLPETMGGGVAFFDVDSDGDPDLLFVNSTTWPHDPPKSPPPTMALYENDGTGHFEDVTRRAGLDLTFYGMGPAVADVDADGDLDLFLTAVGPNRLLLNDGGVFVDVTATAGVAGGDDEWSTGSGFFDVDLDGDLDLFVCNYVRWSREIDYEVDFRLDGVGRAFGPPASYAGTFPYLYRNDGLGPDGRPRFTDVSVESGLQVTNPATGVPVAKSLALYPLDLDGDRYPEVFVANDAVQNFLYHNQGDGTFVEAGEDFGLAYNENGQATAAMGLDAAYLGNELAFVVGNFANEMTSAYVRQEGFSGFLDTTISLGLGAPSRRKLTFGVLFFDVDLDGRLDVLQVNGHVENEIAKVEPSQSYRQSPQLFWNAGLEARTFVEVESAGDLDRELVGRGAATADVDGDGDLDVVLTQVAGPPLLLRNDQALGHHWLRLKLVGRAPNTEAIGAWAVLEAGGRVQRLQVMPTRSYLSQVEPTLTFGLGEADHVDRLEITWPDGSIQSLEDVAIDQLRVIDQENTDEK